MPDIFEEVIRNLVASVHPAYRACLCQQTVCQEGRSSEWGQTDAPRPSVVKCPSVYERQFKWSEGDRSRHYQRGWMLDVLYLQSRAESAGTHCHRSGNRCSRRPSRCAGLSCRHQVRVLAACECARAGETKQRMPCQCRRWFTVQDCVVRVGVAHASDSDVRCVGAVPAACVRNRRSQHKGPPRCERRCVTPAHVNAPAACTVDSDVI